MPQKWYVTQKVTMANPFVNSYKVNNNNIYISDINDWS